jgi:hypothetical protein
VPGRYAASEQDAVERCSAGSLGVVGQVALEGLDRIAARLVRIDRFRRSPLVEPLGAPGETAAGQQPVAEPEPVD